MKEFQFGDFTLNAANRELRQGRNPIVLPNKAFELLLFMAENPGRPLLKGELLKAIWPDSFVEEANLSQNVFLLRKALGSSGGEYIKTLTGRGYQFTAPVIPLASPALPSTAQPMPEPFWTPALLHATDTRLVYEEEETVEDVPFWRSPVRLLLASSTLLLLALAGWLGWSRWEDRMGGPPLQIVLADLDRGTGDPVLDRTLVDALRIDMTQSPFVAVVPGRTVRRVLSEMKHNPDEALTETTARDVCERSGSQAVVHESVQKLGSHYLLMAEATGCVDGTTLAVDKREASGPEALPAAIDALAARLRHDLGESRRTVARFSTPLFPAQTGSIEALEAYSQGILLGQRGKMPEAIALLKQAVSLDPKFAAGWAQLATLSGNAGDMPSERQFIAKAYTLREFANEPSRLNIVALYNDAVTGDLYASIANFKLWSQLYPRDSVPWSGLQQDYRELGRHTEAIAAGQHALAINSHSITAFYSLALEQLHSGDPAAARATCERALTEGLDGDVLHGVLLRVAVLTGDDNLRRAQDTWSTAHPDAVYTLSSEGTLALSEGRVLDGRRLIGAAADALERQSMSGASTSLRKLSAASWFEIGQMEDARAALASAPPDMEEPLEAVDLAELGHADEAHAVLARERGEQPNGTLLNHFFLPWTEAEVDLANHEPQKAIAALEPTLPFTGVMLGIRYTRAQAYMAAGDLPQAEAAFHETIGAAPLGAVDVDIPLSWLNLGRVLAREGKTAEARSAYGQFLSRWSHSNGDPPLLTQARAEASLLEPSRPPVH